MAIQVVYTITASCSNVDSKNPGRVFDPPLHGMVYIYFINTIFLTIDHRPSTINFTKYTPLA